MIRRLVDLVFPPSCASCAAVGREPFCRVCTEALVEAPTVEVPGLDAVAAAFVHGGPVAEAVHRLKYGRRPDLGRTLGRFLQPGLRSMPHDLVVPIPLSLRGLRHRRYNQSMELARAFAPRRVLRRVRDRGPQVGRGRAARFASVAGAFEVRAPVDGASVILVDDVVTTGATLASAAAALWRAGAREVRALTVTVAEPGTPGA
jgi:predicted amidophosphoribosyltransferase